MRFMHLAPLLAAALFVAPRAQAATPIDAPPVRYGIVGIDAMTSTVFQKGQSSFSGIALRLRMRNAALVPNVEILPSFEFWQNNSHVDAFGISTLRRDATLGGNVRWVFRDRALHPYVGAGFGLHFLDDEVTAPGLHGSEALIKGGLDALAGIQGKPDARFGDFIEVQFANVVGYRQFKVNTGLNWNF